MNEKHSIDNEAIERSLENASIRTDKVAIVTGASRGIGAEVAEHLASDGFTVIVNYSRVRQAPDELVETIVSAGGQALAVQADVSSPTEVRRLFETAEGEFGGVDVLVNNAGVMSLAKQEETDDATFSQMISVNLQGTFNTLREGATRVRRGGRIINFSSSVLGSQLPTHGVYSATKAAVEATTVLLAKEMRGREVTVNAVAPGPTATQLFLRGKPPEVVERMSKARRGGA